MKFSLALLLLFSAHLRAQSPASVPPAQIADLTAYLGLAPAQETQLQQIYQSHSHAIHQLWNQLEAKQSELNDLLSATAPDPMAVGNLMIGIQNARRLIGDRTSHDAARNLLTPAQQRKLDDLEIALSLRGAIDQAVQTGLIELKSYPAIMPPLGVSKASPDRQHSLAQNLSPS